MGEVIDLRSGARSAHAFRHLLDHCPSGLPDRHVLPVLPESCELRTTHHAAANNARVQLFNALWHRVQGHSEWHPAIRAISTARLYASRERFPPARTHAFDCVLRLIPLRSTNFAGWAFCHHLAHRSYSSRHNDCVGICFTLKSPRQGVFVDGDIALIVGRWLWVQAQTSAHATIPP